MFLNSTLERNPGLIDAAVEFHRGGLIPPNCFVLDLQAIAENAALLAKAARTHGLALYFTTKQIGFNPIVADRVVKAGIGKAIAVDFREASVLSRNHIPIGHLGHLGQIPTQMIGPALRLEPEVVTVFSVEKAAQISRAASGEARTVQLLLRIASERDSFYTNQEGGICPDQLIDAARTIGRLPNVRIVGVTSFPCLAFDENARAVKPTENLRTIVDAAAALRKELGIRIEQINAPGNTCIGTLPLLAQSGATHGEPGHALTGTTYLHTQPGQPEKPAMVYVSEISHLYGDRAYAFGGGIYRRAKVNHALVGSSRARLFRTEVLPFDPTAIDYYVSLPLSPDHAIAIGDTVLVASRAQVFVSRSYVAVLDGIQTGNPRLAGLFDSWGRPEEEILPNP